MARFINELPIDDNLLLLILHRCVVYNSDIAITQLRVNITVWPREEYMVECFFAGVSCLFRQTNIIWTGFIMILAVERPAILQKQFNTHTFNNYLKLFIHAIDDFSNLVLPYMINFVLFFIYLIWNRSITLGDKSSHSAGLHIVQIFYCFTFITVFSLPIWISRNFMKLYKLRIKRKPVQTFLNLLVLC